MKVYAVIPAGGKGKRGGTETPKQYIRFHGKELIVYTLEVFQQNNLVDEIIISAEPAYFSLLEEIKNKFHLTKITKIVEGGEERQDSVNSALKSINADDNDLIAVHDAARPLLPESILTKAINTAKDKGNALVCLKARDTLLKGDRIVKEYVDRTEIYYVQTPQIFTYKDLKKAMKKAYEKNFIGTDESMLIKELGIDINIVEGSMLNFKVTTTTDIEMFEKLTIHNH
ncbi:MAG: 2-C-methyl-D-erythritol 4-phosphate cytidylyltransferase [Ignavibacteriaceae bacterium]|nr:2-C-methyl-D-erythritol 4-phosphate cytidylyltransferase [Ignavibacteriaceae bacterium]MCW8814256.1 2-C-methyl-D-erythritol 4-phosphate cytidylyltransferase [Chlorobium sp.]MCW8994675.1 2-C-methyl-D-erythritol 4-phosphate cytidylyltransferase [Psychromonas sp.]MCW8816361.1 2-C-methyl-D-erythritol 4-phosphate cytidylyltransferase [Ignavibacteriaceae bacterium]MCW8824444.1 2-C-methyl-D-erythritol 4-phosphate cytidylyltransferase [Ignavibacteriaceae bacterium]